MENTQDLECLNCGSERVVVGSLRGMGGMGGKGGTYFLADETKAGWVTLEHPGIRLSKKSAAVVCLDCGSIIASLDKEEVARKLNRYGADELKSRLGLN